MGDRGRIGIRHESIDPAERRAPLTPAHVAALRTEHGLEVVVQPSRTRVFPDQEMAAAGAVISPDLTGCNVILGVKEVPPAELAPEQAYCFFSHTIKGQAHNMPMLARLLELRGTLLDYELVKNERGRRLVAFGIFAGYAGMINTLWALGRRLRWEGIPNPFERVRRPHRYPDLAAVGEALKGVGKIIQTLGLPPALVPLVVAVAGSGRVARGAQQILKLLPTTRLAAEEMPRFFAAGEFSARTIYRVELNQPDLYQAPDPAEGFDHYRFHRYPERYGSRLEHFLPYLTVLVNGIYWEPRYPRLVTRSFLRRRWEANPNPRLRVIGDITCDVEGSIEATLKATTVDEPVYVYEPLKDRVVDGLEGVGPVIMAVDKLPTELPRQASESFGDALTPFLPALARADFTAPLEDLALPPELARAVIAHRGRLAPSFAYLEPALP